MQIASYAKINWSLRILRKRPDGFHELETLFQQISLHDELTFTRSDHLSLTCDASDIPSDESNLVVRATRSLGAPPVAIELQKRIPAGGGLGGGSSNAAATLRAIDTLFDLRTPNERLHELAVQLGSDVPFFLLGGTSYATGRGEVLTPLPVVAPVPLVLILPVDRVSTAEAFAGIRSWSRPLGVEAYRRMIDDDLLAHVPALTNDFEVPIFARHPRLREYKDALLASGAAWAGMTGSGSTIVGAFRSQAVRDEALRGITGVRAVAAETM